MERILPLLQKAQAFFAGQGVDEPRPSAELLLAHVLGCKRLDLYLRFEQPLREDELERFRAAVRRRLAGEPVQYITGDTEFYGLRLAVSPAVLIPRPETEHLVELAIDEARRRAGAPGADAAAPTLRILDIGTGSGAIAVATAVHLPGAVLTAIDISTEALDMARSNARLHGMEERITFLERDAMDDAAFPVDGEYDLILSNPPYIPLADVPELQAEVRLHEPPHATCDGGDGLRFYRRIAATARGMLAPGGAVIVEIGFGQAPDVTAIFTAAGFEPAASRRDYAGIERVLAFAAA